MNKTYEREYEANYLSRSNPYMCFFYFLVVDKYINILSGGSTKPSMKFHRLRMTVLTLKKSFEKYSH